MNKKGGLNNNFGGDFENDFEEDYKSGSQDKGNTYYQGGFNDKEDKKKVNILLHSEEDYEAEEDIRSFSQNKKKNEGKGIHEMTIKTSKNPFESSKIDSSVNKGFVNHEESFATKYLDNIRKIFDECSERGEIEITKLKGLLDEADSNKAFSILRKKLNNLERNKKGFGGSKMKDDILRFDDFKNLFEFDLKKEEDFDILFATIDELGNDSSSIGLAELEKANKHYDLGLSSEDMEIMLKYIGKDPNVVTKDELKKAMGVINE